MDPLKELQVEAFKNWLVDNDVSFMQKANGHFQIYNNKQKLIYQVWATTEKMHSEETGTKYVGIHMIQRTILERLQVEAVTTQAEVSLSPLRARFINDCTAVASFDGCVLVIAVKLPTGATEVITNYQQVASKVEYYLSAYDDNFKLRSNPEVRVVGFMLV